MSRGVLPALAALWPQCLQQPFGLYVYLLQAAFQMCLFPKVFGHRAQLPLPLEGQGAELGSSVFRWSSPWTAVLLYFCT